MAGSIVQIMQHTNVGVAITFGAIVGPVESRVENSHLKNHVSILETYMKALGNSEYQVIKGLFAPNGKVLSPFLGEVESGLFFDRLANVSTENVITPIDIFTSATDKNHATCYFQYDWTVKDGTLISFKVMDLFTFADGSDKIEYLNLIYDTHPIRATAGNKYEE